MTTFYRRLPRFDYLKTKSIDEVLALLENNQSKEVKLYAGGTDLVPRLKRRLISRPKLLVDLKGLSALDYIHYDKTEGLRIGALSTIYSVANSPIVRERFSILSQGANSIAAIQIQSRGTIVGNICSAVPSADSAPPLLCLGANLVCVSGKGERVIGIEDFFTGPSETVLRGDELLKEIHISNIPETSKGAYIKLSTRARMDLAIVGVGALVALENGTFKDVRIGLGAVAPTPIRARKAEDMLRGQKANDRVLSEAAHLASEESKPIDDHRASAKYRRMMVEVLVKRAIHQALNG